MLNTIKEKMFTLFYRGVILSLVLGFLIQTVAAFPLYAFIVNEEEIETVELNDANNVIEEDVKLLFEIEEYRTEHSKVFMRSDGKLEYAYYDEIVNYYDGQRFQEVDATFYENDSNYDSIVNNYNVKIPKKITDNKKIKLSSDDSSIELIYSGISKTDATIIENYDDNSSINNLKNIKGQVSYENIFENVDLIIESTGSYFKENIILNEYINNFVFSYTLKLKNLSLIEEDNIIKFIDNNQNVIYTIDPYFMVDANSRISYDIKVDYKLIKQNEYFFTVIPNNEFLENASYPLTIDPILKYESDSTSNSIIRVKSFLNNSYSSITSKMQLTKYLYESDGISFDDSYYGVMQVDLSDFVDVYDIENATIFLRSYSSNYATPVVVREIRNNNASIPLIFDEIDGYTDYVYKTSALSFKYYDEYYYGLDITNYFNDSYARDKLFFEFSPELFDYNEETQYYNSNMSSDYKPYLQIILSEKEGLSPYKTYETLSFGDAGDYYVDTVHGNGTFITSIYNENNLPLNLIYSSESKNQNFGYGKGFRLSVNEIIETFTYDNQNYLCLTDATGYKEYFYYDFNEALYYSFEGNDSQIRFLNNEYLYSTDEFRKKYDIDGKLIEIYYFNDKNSINDDINLYIEYDERNYVKSIRQNMYQINLSYNDNEDPERTLEYATIDIVNDHVLSDHETLGIVKSFRFSYDSNYNLLEAYRYISDYNMEIEIIEDYKNISNEEKEYKKDAFKRGNLEKRILFDYDYVKNLTKAFCLDIQSNYEEEIDNYEGMQVSYTNERITQYGIILRKTNSFKTLMYIDYNSDYTQFEDYNGYVKTYIFDSFDHTISIYDNEGYAIYYEYEDFSNELLKNTPNFKLKHRIKYISDPLNVINNPVLNCSFEELGEEGEILNWNENIAGNESGKIVSNINTPYGNCALEVSSSNSSNSSNEVYQEVSLSPGTYNLFACVKTKNNLFNNSSNYVGYLKVESTYGESLQSSQCVFNNNNFEFISSEFNVPYSMKVKVICGIKSNSEEYQLNSSDKVYFDNIQIIDNNINNLNNLIPNNSFETNSNWNNTNCVFYENQSFYEEDGYDKLFGLHNMNIPYDGVLTQDFNYNSKSGDKFNLGGFVYYHSGLSDIRLSVRFYDSFSASSSPYYTLKFSNISEKYVYSTANLIIDENLEVSNEYNKIQIKIENYGIIDGCIDNIHLFNFHNGESFEYDDQGNLIEIDDEEEKITFEYNTDGKISKITTEKYLYNIEYGVNEESEEEISQTDTITEKIDKTTNKVLNTTTERLFTYYTNDSGLYYPSTDLTEYFVMEKVIFDENNQGTCTSSIINIKNQALLSTVDEFGNKIEYKYDDFNRINKILNSVLEYEEFEYDDRNNIIKKSLGKYEFIFNEGNNYIYNEYQSIEYYYNDNGDIEKVIIDNNQNNYYNFEYDEYHNITGIYFNNNLIAKYEYYYVNGINTGLISREINSKGEFFSYEYTKDLLISSCSRGIQIESSIIDKQIIYSCVYDSSGNLCYYNDNIENKTYYYEYDSNNNLIKINIFDENNVQIIYNDDGEELEYNDNICFIYDEDDKLVSTTYNFQGESITIEFDYDEENELSSTKINDAIFTSPTQMITETTKYFESFIKTSNNNLIIQEKMYLDNSGNTMIKQIDNSDLIHVDLLTADTSLFSVTSRIKKQEIITDENSFSYEYYYDLNNNINKVIFSDLNNSSNNRTYYYSYLLGSLIKEEVYVGLIYDDESVSNYTQILSANYSYDKNGNIVLIQRSIKSLEYSNLPTIIEYSYENVYQLVSCTVDGVIYQTNYDSQGNPLNYKNFNLTFEYDNLIEMIDPNSGNKITYEYNSMGIRTKKIINDIIYEYTTFNDLLLIEKVISSDGTYSIIYLYDENNTAIGFKINNENYYYVRNLMGEIIFIVDQNSQIVGEYKYDAFGNILNLNSLSPLAEINSLRYKGYYYDAETQLYWVSSRYYSPELCRWISPDSIEYLDPESINGLNLYAYCGNDPVNRFDPSGHAWEWSNFWQAAGYLVTGIGAIVAGALVIASGVATWPMLLVAGITIGAGALTTINGVAEVGDLAFNYNFMEDGVFGGNSAAYNTYASITGTVATVGSIVCGGWYRYNTPRIQAYKNIGNYDFSGTLSDSTHLARPYQHSTLLQKNIIKYGKMVKESSGAYKFTIGGSYKIGWVSYGLESVGSHPVTWKLVLDICKQIIFHAGF